MGQTKRVEVDIQNRSVISSTVRAEHDFNASTFKMKKIEKDE